jgi:hypothetical protein
MRYTLVIDGVEFPGQQVQGEYSAQQIARSFLVNYTSGGVSSLDSDDGKNATLIHWGRVTTVQVIVED